MFGGIFKFTLSIYVLFLIINLLWQAPIVDALPTLAADENVVKSNEDASRFSPVNSHMGVHTKKFRTPKRMKMTLEDRLKRFRMLDQDEFQEMLKSLSQQTGEEQSKASNAIDTIGGMQLANYWMPA